MEQILCPATGASSSLSGGERPLYLADGPHIGVAFPRSKLKSFESGYPPPEAVALRPIHGFATAIS